ncbi:MAG: TIGR02996 domain-containing protein [Myxococcales bacterium]|nr:TIGR02996 domain-containing protein [Myxococcales bacterium]
MSHLSSPDARALLAAVRSDIDSHEPWLVLADWLTERGDVRGELVILAHRLREGTSTGPERRASTRRIDAIQKAHEAQWRAEVDLPAGARPQWRYGFMVGLWLPWTTSSPSELERVVDSPAAALLRHLDLRRNGLTVEALTALVRSTELGRLSSLDLSGNPLGPEGASVLAGASTLRGLTSLGMWGARIGPTGVQEMASTSALSGLTALDLGVNEICEGIASLMSADFCSNLRFLDLSYNGMSASDGIPCLDCSSLTSLRLRGNDLGTTGVAALAESKTLRGVTRLNLFDAGIDDEGAAILAGSSTFTALTALNLGANRIGDEGAIALARSTTLTSLRTLRLDGGLTRRPSDEPRIGPAGATALARSATLAGLTSLDLGSNALGDQGAAALAASSTLGGLESLAVPRNEITDEGATALIHSTSLSELTDLDLHLNPMDASDEAEWRQVLAARPNRLHCRTTGDHQALAELIAQLELPIRLQNCLTNANIDRPQDVGRLTLRDISKSFGRKSWRELAESLPMLVDRARHPSGLGASWDQTTESSWLS